MPLPTMWTLHPELYSYNKISKRHALKTGKAYKAQYAANSENFIESTTMMHRPLVVSPAEIEPAPIVATPLLPPLKVEVPPESKKHEVAREQIKAIISAEVKQNSKVYADKTKEDLGALFRELLIERLAIPAAPPKAKPNVINKSTKPAKAPTKTAAKKKPLFKLKPLQTSEDEDDETQSSESEA